MANELAVAIAAVKEAGAVLLSMQTTGFTVSHKANRDLLTEADLAANAILRKAILDAFPDDAWLSEESHDDITRLSKQRVWIVDPIDGTIEYSKNIPEYAISLALVVAGVPTVGVVFNPATDELFFATQEGAWLQEAALRCDCANASRLTLLASRSEEKRGEWDRFKDQHDVKIVGSIAYKLALVAAGRAHATFSLSPKSEWDIAAGVLLVQASGGCVMNAKFAPIHFNQANVLVPGVIACSQAVKDDLLRLIKSGGA